MLLISLLVLSVLGVGVFLSVVYFFATVEGFVWAVCSNCDAELFPGGAIRVSERYREELMVRIGVF